jgi:hypothetical protein
MQPLFRKLRVFSDLTMFLAVMAGYALIRSPDLRSERPARWAAVRFIPVAPDPSGFGPARLVGAWRVEVDDPRFGGVSALALDGDTLLALTDSGTLVRLPRPGRRRQALVQDLPAGPGNSRFKVNRDSEALARDPAGRGWWVAFEQWHQLWLYDPAFRRALAHIELGSERWGPNTGIEAMVADNRGLTLFREPADEWLRIEGRTLRRHRMTSRYGSLSDAARLPDGRVLAVARKMALAGFAKRLLAVEDHNGSVQLRSLARLSLGATANVEAIAVEPRGQSARLWLMTDNDFRPRAPTLLVALDLP